MPAATMRLESAITGEKLSRVLVLSSLMVAAGIGLAVRRGPSPRP